MKGRDWPPCALRRATDVDLERILALEQACFTHPWTVDQLHEAIRSENRSGVLALHTPRDGGRDVVSYCVFQVVADELSIHTLAVAPLWRRRGIGRWVLERALHAGARLGAETAFIEVRQGNRGALELYRSVGFEVISTREGYYEGPREAAVVLRKTGLRGGRARG